MTPFFVPHFKVQKERDALRLIPLSEEAEQSVTQDNDVYRQAIEKLKEAVPYLRKAL